MRVSKVLFVVVAVSGFVFAGCGDDDGGGNGTSAQCTEAFTACGGDPIGDWNFVAFCDAVGLDMSDTCPTATIAVTRNSTTGSINVAAAGTYTQTLNIDMAANVTLPGSCLMGMFTCDTLPAIDDMIKSCTVAGDGCTCVIESKSTDVTSGDWTVEGNVFVTDAGTADEDRVEFCIAGASGQSQGLDGSDRVIWRK